MSIKYLNKIIKKGLIMFAGQQALKQYRTIENNVQAEYASSYHLTKMLFSGALKSLNLAASHMVNKNFESKAKELSRSFEIIMGLKECLNLKDGGELAKNLDELYAYMSKKVIESSFSNDPKIVRHVADLMREISDGWDAMPIESRK
jgi:flagellar secretion chaperone FliS